LSRLSGGVHNGFIAELVGDPAASSGAGPDRDLVVLLEDVQDPRNLGAILRICEGAGVGKVLVRDRGSAPLSPAVVKTAAGATEWLDIERVVNSAAALDKLKKEGFWVYGTDPGGSAPWRIDLSGKVVLCFGGEAKGLRSRTRKVCDELIGLPMRGAVESLNVSAAAAAVLFEAVRQRLEVDPLPPGGDSG
jgi:23S rRNA (guanosine2251-2'-O)-methyltransferase